jgi:hypothetical protein
MWYSKTVEAGALDVLAGDLDPDLTFQELNNKVSYGSRRSWPNPDSLYKYLKSKADLINSLEHGDKYNELMNKIYYASNVIEKLLQGYSKDPEDLPLYNRFISLAIEYSKIRGIPKFDIGIDNFKIMDSYLETHNYVYTIGYKRLLSLYKEGAYLPISIAYALVTNSDLRASANLQDSDERKELRNLLLNENEKISGFDANKYSNEQIVDNIVNLNSTDIQDIFYSSGMSFVDFKAFFTKLVESNYFDPNESTRNYIKPLITGRLEYEFIVFLHSIKLKFASGLYEKYLNFYFGERPEALEPLNKNYVYSNKLQDNDVYNALSDDIDIWLQITSKYNKSEHQIFLAAFGLLDRKEVIKYYLSLQGTDIENSRYIRSDAKPTQEEIEEYKNSLKKNIEKQVKVNESEEAKTVKPKEKIETTNEVVQVAKFSPDDFLNTFVKSGDITIKKLSDPEYVKLVDDIANALHYTENERDILEYVKDTRVVVFNTNAFYQKLSERNPPVYNGFKMSDTKAEGIMRSNFKLFSNEEPGLILQLNSFITMPNVIKDNILKAIGFGVNEYNLAVMAHEIGHLLDYGIKGGKEVFRNLDPKTTLKPNESYNQSRLYLSDIREIVARVYGNLSYVAEALHEKVETLRTDDLIRQAAISELVDSIMSNEDSWLLSTPMVSEATLQSWAEAGFGGYNYSKAPYSDATKTYMRQKEKAKDFYIAAGKQKRREILLKFLKELNSIKRQLSEVINSTEEIKLKQKLEKDLAGVQNKIEAAKQGAYDYDINLVIKAVANYVAFKDLSITNEIAADPSYVAQPHVTKPENYSSGIKGDISPLTFTELREMRDFDLSRLQEGEEGGKSLREKKPSFMSLDIYNPDWQEDIRGEYFGENQTKTSFNFKKWFKN